MVDRDLSDAECRVMAAMRKAVLTMPDLCAVGALQDFASLYLKVEPLLTAEMAATMFGAGVFIASQAEIEMRAQIQAMMAISNARTAHGG